MEERGSKKLYASNVVLTHRNVQVVVLAKNSLAKLVAIHLFAAS
jgi:hypothetical protein